MENVEEQPMIGVYDESGQNGKLRIVIDNPNFYGKSKETMPVELD